MRALSWEMGAAITQICAGNRGRSGGAQCLSTGGKCSFMADSALSRALDCSPVRSPCSWDTHTCFATVQKSVTKSVRQDCNPVCFSTGTELLVIFCFEEKLVFIPETWSVHLLLLTGDAVCPVRSHSAPRCLERRRTPVRPASLGCAIER